MMQLSLTKGKTTIIDDADFDVLSKYKWFASETNKKGVFYAKAVINKKPVYLHRFLLSVTQKSSHVDHIDNDTLNNQRSNLRACTRLQNMYNKKKRVSKAVYTGVSKKIYKGRVYFFASISVNNKPKYLGSFPDERSAAIAFNNAAIKIRGEFAKLNEI